MQVMDCLSSVPILFVLGSFCCSWINKEDYMQAVQEKSYDQCYSAGFQEGILAQAEDHVIVPRGLFLYPG